ncbi:MAG: RNA-binding S4 domain-containing protein [Muribaculaceae bacterium]|nr:RNA-binding S4 domain-containing protein [Muribaculaceae bacterium]
MGEERVDKWLWAMRVFKTRTVATDSCKKGRVSVGPTAIDSVVVKPSRVIKPGDIIHVKKPPVTWSFKVKALSNNRLGAKLVPEYMENVTPKSQMDLLEVVKISGFVDRRKGLGRPTKREGRELSRFAESIDDPIFMDEDHDFIFDFDEDDFEN